MRLTLQGLVLFALLMGVSQPVAQAQAVNPFTLSETPPVGVPAVVPDLNMPDLACPAPTDATPVVRISPGTVELATRYLVCLDGFSPGADIALNVARPDGRAQSILVTPDAQGHAEWRGFVAPGVGEPDPLGAYAVSAAQSAAAAATAFNVVSPSAPRLTVFPPSGGPGTYFQIFALGGAEQTPLSLYRRTAAGYEFAAHLSTDSGTVYGGAVGEYVLPTSDETPANTYLVRGDLAPSPAAMVDVRSGVGQPAPSGAASHALKRRDVPPGATAAQLLFGQGGGGGRGSRCVLQEDSEPKLPPEVLDPWFGCSPRMGEWFELAFEGFQPNRDITIRVTTPDGTLRTTVLTPLASETTTTWVRDPSPGFRHDWRGLKAPTVPPAPSDWLFGLTVSVEADPRPADPFGTYQVDAAQSSLHTAGQFVLGQSTEPILEPVSESVRPGDAAHIRLGGYPPGQPVQLHLYRQEPSTINSIGRYLTTLVTPPTDDYGSLVYELQTDPDDQPGGYVLQSTPPAHEFWATREFRLVTSNAFQLESRRQRLQAVAFVAIGESDHVWSNVISQQAAPITDLERFYGGAWLNEVRDSVLQSRSTGNYRVAHLTGLNVKQVTELPDGQLEALATEQWDDREFSADGALVRDRSGTLDQRYVFDRVGDRWLITESQLIRR